MKLILFSQHGMIDDNRAMEALAHKVAPPQSHVIAPNLERIQTLLTLEPLISKVEQIAEQAFRQYPYLPARIIATSLGGVIWVEVLSRYPEWWERIESLVLLGSPIGGADAAKIVDPFGWGIGIAKYLGQNRRPLAEQITAKIPTLVVAGNITGGGDLMVPIESTKLKRAYFICLDGVTHWELKTHPAVVEVIQEFWSEPRKPLPAPEDNLISRLIEHFRAVPGITDASERDFPNAKTIFSFADGTSIRTWTNLVGVNHVFIADQYGKCQYAAFVGLIHSAGLQQAIDQLTVFATSKNEKKSDVTYLGDSTKMLNPLNAFYETLRLSEKIFDAVKEWNTEAQIASSFSPTAEQVIQILFKVPGMNIAHSRDFNRAQPIFTLKADGTLVKIYINPVGVKHIFLADSNNKMIFGGYVGWIHTEELDKAIDKIKDNYSN